MIFGFVKKLVKYYIDKIINWLRIKKPKIIETGKFGEDGWSISIGDLEDGDT